MKNITTLIALLFLSILSLAQTNISNWSSSSNENIVVERLAGDTLTTSFLIQVRKDVPLHYHAYHSEHVYALSGKGEFVLNGDTSIVSAGTYTFIPSESRHTVKVISDEPLRVLSIQSPEFLGKDRIKVP